MVQFKQKLEKKEKVVIILAIVMLVISIYYFGCYKPCQTMIESYQTDDLMQEFTIEQMKRKQNENMEQEIENNQAAGLGEVYPYNNLQMEVEALNTIMAKTTSFDLSFSDAIQDGSAVKRPVALSFTTSDYATAKAIIEELYTCKSRCIINDLSISSSQKDDNKQVEWSTSVQLTFIEAMQDATSTEGLVRTKENTAETLVEELTDFN